MLKTTGKHVSVLLHELTNSIHISKKSKNIIVDCTLGWGGHAEKIIESLNPWDIFIGFDADEKNLKTATERLFPLIKEKQIESHFIHSNFLHLKEELEKRNIAEITSIYYDLWISSMHVDEADRGFSFKNDGPLDMRYDKTSWKSAYDVVNFYEKDKLIEIFREYGEEPASRKIAEKIVEERKKKKIETTGELANIVSENMRFPKAQARIFQAIRMEVNNELENTEKSIYDALQLLKQGGHIFVITFHSLEDRLVKHLFKRETRDCICSELICNCKHKKIIKLGEKKPIIPSNEEIKNNSRARSAKGRSAEKI